jgi:hypothetical protein
MNWNYFYKIDEGWDGAPTNVLYEPFVSDDKSLFLMHYNNDNDYFENLHYPEEMVDFYFQREARWLERFQGFDFAPEVVDIDYKDRKIIYKWYNKNLNRGLYTDEFELPEGWQQQVKDVIRQISEQGIFKLNLYPHTFYFDDDYNLKVSDMYACIDNGDIYIDTHVIKPVLDPNGGVSNERFEMFTEDGKVNLRKVYDYSMSINYGQWPGDFLNG